MSLLYIIGNGFDRAHDLPTGYGSFRSYLDKQPEMKTFLWNLEDAYGVQKTDLFWESFEASLGKGYWFETQFEDIATSIIRDMVDNEGNPIPNIEDTLRVHWKQYYEFIDALNICVRKWINDTIDTSSLVPQFRSLQSAGNLFLTFNYTSVLEDVYRISDEKVLHIHGRAKTGNVIMGHGNRAVIDSYIAKSVEAKEWNNGFSSVYSAIADFYKYSFKNTQEIIQKNSSFFQKLRGVNRVNIFGHSLGMVDMPYFLEVKKSILPNSEWYFYLYVGENETLQEKKEQAKEKIKLLHLDQRHVHFVPNSKF